MYTQKINIKVIMKPEELKYTKDHEWIHFDGDECTIGITQHAADELGDIVFIDVYEDEYTEGDEIGTIEAVKTVAEIYAPMDGRVILINPKLESDAGIVNKDPFGDGWLCKFAIHIPPSEDLLTFDEYQNFIS